jgi:ketosteroid isomerase-like protein
VLENEAERVIFRPAAAFASRSGDLGYAYGAYETGAQAAGGAYMRIWKRQGGKWLVVVQVMNPAPPPRQG